MGLDSLTAYYKEPPNLTLFKGDSLELLSRFEAESIDMIFADPPYLLSNGGNTCKSGTWGKGDKGKWDESLGFKEDYEFTKKWLSECKRVLSENGSIWISGTQHIIYKVGFILAELNYHIMNDIIWYKPNAPPNLSCRYFTHSHETLLWAKKTKKVKHTFNYASMKEWNHKADLFKNEEKQMRSVWYIPQTPASERKEGKHPTQKPKELLDRIILASTNEGDLVLDPFNGSGTTGICAYKNKRKYIGIDLSHEYLDLTIRRLKTVKKEVSLKGSIKDLTDFLKV